VPPRNGLRCTLPAATLLGAATVPGFAPFHLYVLPFLTLALLIALWRNAVHRRHAALIGFCFGLGYFLAGVSWVYVSLHDFGAIPAPIAGALTLLFCVILASYPAFAGWGYHALGARSNVATLAALPALWTLTEWLRGWLFTGFPWVALGYAQIPHSPLAGFAPVFGIYGVSFATVLTAAALVMLWTAHTNTGTDSGASVRARALRLARQPACLTLIATWLSGFLLLQIHWTHPEGAPVTVSLLQGNVPQDMKWRADRIRSTLNTYESLAGSSTARLIVLPETALPLFLHDVPREYLARLAAHARANHGDILIGAPERTDGRNYYNSVLSFGSAPEQTYRKSHLVPFGEFVPLKPLFGWFFDVAQIPLLDFARGTETPEPLAVAGQRVAVNICYEDAFGEEIIRQLPHATLLVNVSNVAWFGRSIAPQQHLQISQARALETGRYMLRATNTGITAIIDERGRVRQAAPEFATAVVSGEVQGYAGATPYVRGGNVSIVMLALAALLAGIRWRR
jgi:apolipoprotein N-acyltransferase